MRVIEYYVHVDGQDVPEMFCLVTDLHDWRGLPGGHARRRVQVAVGRVGDRAARGQVRDPRRRPSTGPIFRSHCPDMIRQEHAAWIDRHRARPRRRPRSGPAAPPRPARAAAPGSRCSPGRSPSPQPAAPPSPAPAPAPPPPACPPADRGPRDATLHDLGRRRVTIDRDRHRDHKTKARQAFPAAGRGITTRNAPATITVCGPIAA